MKNEKDIISHEWLQFAKNDLESAEVILRETDNFHISVYHSHQAIEKILKWFLLKNKKRFPFTHDLKVLLRLTLEIKDLSHYLEGILFIDNLYPQLRYPTGDKISKNDANKSFKIAKNIVQTIAKS